MWRRKIQDPAGFNLVEMMVVLLIAGMVLIAAAPSMIRRSSWYRVEGPARDLSTHMQMARQMAVGRRVPYRLTLERLDNTYQFERQLTDSTWARDPNEVYSVTGVSMTSTIGGSPSATEIRFAPDGTIRSQDAPTEVQFVSSHQDTATVVLVRTGRVTVRTSWIRH